jgi:Mg2+ and Co2+ transporter CorA
LLAEFQHFSNYWYFSELANKDEEIEHFQFQCDALRLEPVKHEVEQEIEKLSQSLERFYQFRSAEAVNRLAMMSMILGGGAMVTGFFGMNFGREFEKLFFNPEGNTWAHKAAIAAVSSLTIGSLLFGIYMVVANWADYKIILLPARWRKRLQQGSLRRTPDWEQDEESHE